MKPTKIIVTRIAEKGLARVPAHIVDKLDAWFEVIETDGIEEARKIPGFHDEPLKGKRRGQRSIRLSRFYRAIYEVKIESNIEIVFIKEVTKHDY
jgi:proteic killer suppression protein